MLGHNFLVTKTSPKKFIFLQISKPKYLVRKITFLLVSAQFDKIILNRTLYQLVQKKNCFSILKYENFDM